MKRVWYIYVRLVVLGIDYRVVVKSVEWLETVVMMVTIKNDQSLLLHSNACSSLLTACSEYPLFLSYYAGQTPGYPRNTVGQALLFTQEDRHN